MNNAARIALLSVAGLLCTGTAALAAPKPSAAGPISSAASPNAGPKHEGTTGSSGKTPPGRCVAEVATSEGGQAVSEGTRDLCDAGPTSK